jgi:hypothetical protein
LHKLIWSLLEVFADLCKAKPVVGGRATDKQGKTGLGRFGMGGTARGTYREKRGKI